MRTSTRILLNSGILFGYPLFSVLIMSQLHVDYGCALFYTCGVEPPSLYYVVPGRVLAFLNLWALIFYVNMGGFADHEYEIAELILPSIISTVWAAVVFFLAGWMVFIGGVLTMGVGS